MNHVITALFRTLVLTLLSLSLAAVPASAEGGLTKIADDVYSYVDVRNAAPSNSYGANAGIVIGKDGVAVIDTLISAKEARRLIRDIRAITDKPIKYVVNTHYHLDHAFGNIEFAKLGAVIISHASDGKNLAENGERVLKSHKNYGLTEADMEGTDLVYPQIMFTDRMEIDLGGLRVELIYPGKAHTTGNIFVVVPDRKVVFAGDILFTGYHPYMAEGDIGGWVAALDMLGNMSAGASVPGHGPLSTAKDVSDMKAYIILFDREAQRLAKQSNDADAILAELKNILPKRPEGDGLIRANVSLRYIRK